MDYYQILGVGRYASADEIEYAYSELRFKYTRPNYQGDQDTADKMMQQIEHAYATLSDTELRSEYNRRYDYEHHIVHPSPQKRKPSALFIILLVAAVALIGTAIAYLVEPDWFASAAAPNVSAPIQSSKPLDTPFATIANGEKVYRSSAGTFGGTFTMTTPEESPQSCRIDIYDVKLTALSNGIQYMAYAEYNPYISVEKAPTGKKVKQKLENLAEEYVKAVLTEDAKMVSSKQITGETKGGAKLAGIEYKMQINYKGKNMDLYGRTYFQGDNVAAWFTLCHILYFSETGSDKMKEAKAFWDSCFFY